MSGAEKKENIQILDAYENNLKHIDVTIEPETFTCVTGVSGCGKSSLVYDTLYAESQRNFLESMSTNMFGQKIMDKPKVGEIKNLSPALSVSQSYYNNNPRSTVGTLTDISHYLRTLFALIINYEEGTYYTDSFFSSNNPESCCPHCSGVGEEYDIDESAVIPDRKKTLKKGAIIYYKGTSKSAEYKLMMAICEHFGIDPDTPIEKLTKKQLDILLYRTEPLSFQLSFKSPRGTYRRKTLQSKGVMVELREKLADIDTQSTKASIGKYLIKKQCTHCNGTRLKSTVLSRKVCDMNIADVESLKIDKLASWISAVRKAYGTSVIASQINQLLLNIEKKAECIILLNVGYLSIDRSIPTLSGGEIQRIRIANQLNCPLKGLIYILDEPCKGLHFQNIQNIINATNNLVQKGNTVIAIEHNPYYISKADKVIELGPHGGKDGGKLIYCGKPKKSESKIKFKRNPMSCQKSAELSDISFHNISKQSVKFPIGAITCITGVSGSGKSSLMTVIEQCVENQRAVFCKRITGLSEFKQVKRVNQQPIGKNSRSTIVSYLEIYDNIRDLYALQAGSKYSASDFSMNVSGGRCEYCQGNGTLKIELNYLPESYVTCPECQGKRFKPEILSVKLYGRNIYETLSTPIQEIIHDFKNDEQIFKKLKCMVDIGLGYLSLGQMSMHLSGGEAQRIKLAKVLGSNATKNTLFILDEPTSGLSRTDIDKLISVIESVKKMGNTVLIVEHNISFIAEIADYMIDFGVNAGDQGGIIVAQGLPKQVYENDHSSWINTF